ncbi:MAG: NAD(P)H-hydrate dehydratase [Burkholderiaceae bacterium]|nr:NAD(P)H-hydrate dehydratase [Burkholderiaceae bacterium]
MDPAVDARPTLPVAVLPATRSWPLHDTAASRAMEAAAASQLPPHALMARAGRGVARLALALAPRARSVLVLAGPGNNGGDALLAAALLHDAGVPVWLVLLADPGRLPTDATWALAQVRRRAGLDVHAAMPAGWQADLVIDGLLGLGLARAPAGPVAEAIAAVGTYRGPVLAIDLPSGLDGDRGTTFGGIAIRATHTLALLSLKPGLFTAEGRDHAGQVWFDDLGVAPVATRLRLAGPPAMLAVPHSAHKGRFGDLVVVGGAPGMTGAAALAAHAALAAGAGRVYLASLNADAGSATCRLELMQRRIDDMLEPETLRARTVVAGCGGGEPMRAVLPALLRHAARLVLDADALNAVAADTALQHALAARGAAGRPTVLTPHPLEAARLLDCSTGDVQGDRLGAAGALAERFGAVVVLKGSGSVMASPDGALMLCPFGNGRLATAGTGDVLAGWLGGLWARQATAVADADTLPALASAAVAGHGLAAEQAPGRGPLLATDLIAAMQALG